LADTSKTLPTYHSKILIAQDPIHSHEIVCAFLDKLNQSTFTTKNDLIEAVREIVPEFIQMPEEQSGT
jgi:hypothetical protein